jgi:hypothetical protein
MATDTLSILGPMRDISTISESEILTAQSQNDSDAARRHRDPSATWTESISAKTKQQRLRQQDNLWSLVKHHEEDLSLKTGILFRCEVYFDDQVVDVKRVEHLPRPRHVVSEDDVESWNKTLTKIHYRIFPLEKGLHTWYSVELVTTQNGRINFAASEKELDEFFKKLEDFIAACNMAKKMEETKHLRR